MSPIPRVHRLSLLTGLSQHCRQGPPPGTWALLQAAARHRLADEARQARPRPHP
jgi:hypothetical protein